jgi:hypothetical protein
MQEIALKDWYLMCQTTFNENKISVENIATKTLNRVFQNRNISREIKNNIHI